MSRILNALTAEPWAIDPSWLPLLSALAQRNHSAPEVEAAREWQKRDYDLMAGPGAQRIAGAQRAYSIDGVGILPIVGPIFPRANMMTEMSGASSISMLMNDHRLIMENSEIYALMLLMDTPGGAVSGVNAFADAVAAGAKRKMTTTYVAGSAASAGYWIATQAQEIAVDRTSILGSIGVVAGIPKQVEPDSEGYIDFEIVSSNAKNKRPDPASEDGTAEIRSTLDAIEQQFIADVARGRNVSADKVIADFGQGGVKVGKAAVNAGMADKVQSQEATLKGLRQYAANQRKMASLKK